VSAFTLVEILAAMVFLAILLPAIFQGIALSNRASALVERQATALQLAQNKMTELTLDDTWLEADPSGDFEEWPGFRWESTQTPWEPDSMMTLLAVQVFFKVQEQDRHITLSTLVTSNTTASTSSTTSSRR